MPRLFARALWEICAAFLLRALVLVHARGRCRNIQLCASLARQRVARWIWLTALLGRAFVRAYANLRIPDGVEQRHDSRRRKHQRARSHRSHAVAECGRNGPAVWIFNFAFGAVPSKCADTLASLGSALYAGNAAVLALVTKVALPAKIALEPIDAIAAADIIGRCPTVEAVFAFALAERLNAERSAVASAALATRAVFTHGAVAPVRAVFSTARRRASWAFCFKIAPRVVVVAVAGRAAAPKVWGALVSPAVFADARDFGAAISTRVS